MGSISKALCICRSEWLLPSTSSATEQGTLDSCTGSCYLCASLHQTAPSSQPINTPALMFVVGQPQFPVGGD